MLMLVWESQACEYIYVFGETLYLMKGLFPPNAL